MDRSPGTLIDGKYEVVERLGSGGMGEVYRVRHIHLDHDRVIKVLRPDLAQQAVVAERFAREARTATQIKHPNVATFYDFSRLEDGSFYMVWEHIEGEEVESWLRTRGVFPFPLAIDLGIQALRGLEAIHSAGVIHRDISPDNLLIAEPRPGRFQLKIIDLGLAKDLEQHASLDLTEAGSFLGKLRYCSPEQAQDRVGDSLDLRTDLYSLSAVLYEMVCGLPPFESESDHGFIMKRLSEDPIPLASRNPERPVPAALAEVIEKGMAREREERFPNAVAYIEALEVARERLEAEPPAAEPRRPPAPPRRKRELSREERLALLARIEGVSKPAASPASPGAKLVERARRALKGGDLESAEELLDQAETQDPRAEGLVAVRSEARKARESLEFESRVREAERLLDRYIREKKQKLASMALEALCDLYPNHPKRGDYESWVRLLDEEAEEERRAEESLARAREALTRGDFAVARKALEELDRTAPSERFAETLRVEIAEAEKSRRQSSDVEECKERARTLLEEGRLTDAEREIETLADLEITKVTVDFFRRRLEEERSREQKQELSQGLEERYRQRVASKDWFGARETALELERLLPESRRAAEMFAEVNRLEELDRRQASIEQGVKQIEGYLADGRVAEAELGLKILAQMDPQNPNCQLFEQRINELRGR